MDLDYVALAMLFVLCVLGTVLAYIWSPKPDPIDTTFHDWKHMDQHRARWERTRESIDD